MGQRSRGNDPNTPERRQRLLKLIDDYLRQLNDLPLRRHEHQRQGGLPPVSPQPAGRTIPAPPEEKTSPASPASSLFERLLNLITPRRRGAAVQGEAVARELEAIRKTIATASTACANRQPGKIG